MAVSVARDLRYSTAAALQGERPAAKIIPFKGRGREPLEEPRCGGTNAQMAQVIQLADRGKPLEAQISGRTCAQNAQVISFPILNSQKERPSGRPSAQVIALPTSVSSQEQPSIRPNAQVIPFLAQDIKPRQGKSNDAETCQGIKVESSRDGKAKGQTRRSEAPPDIHYILAWLVWAEYVKIMLSMGIRVSEFLKRVEFHDHMKRGR